MGQAVGLAGHRERVEPVSLGHFPDMASIADPGQLVGHQRSQQITIQMTLVAPLAVGQLDLLVGVDRRIAPMLGVEPVRAPEDEAVALAQGESKSDAVLLAQDH